MNRGRLFVAIAAIVLVVAACAVLNVRPAVMALVMTATLLAVAWYVEV